MLGRTCWIALGLGAALLAGPAPALEPSLAPAPPMGLPTHPPFELGSERPVEVQVLLHSIELSLDLLDAYGRCREDSRDHAECMAILRSSLLEARTRIER